MQKQLSVEGKGQLETWHESWFCPALSSLVKPEAPHLQKMNHAGLRVGPTLPSHLPGCRGHSVSWLPLVPSLCFPIICSSPTVQYLSFLLHKPSRIKMGGIPFDDVPVGCQALCKHICAWTTWSSRNLQIVSINPVLQIREGGSRRLNAAVSEKRGIFLTLQSQYLF